jgi:hypothetical protein
VQPASPALARRIAPKTALADVDRKIVSSARAALQGTTGRAGINKVKVEPP